MASAVKSFDPNLRQQLAQMLAGDAKAGSLRADLVKGLVGSQTGDDDGLVGMTPVGAAFKMDAANRDQNLNRRAVKQIGAMAGMLPGAGEAASVLHPLEEEAVSKALQTLTGDEAAHISEHDLPTILNAAQYSRRSLNPNDQKILDSAISKLTPENAVKPGTAMSNDELDKLVPGAEVPVTGVRAQLEQAAKDPKIVDAKDPPTVNGTAASLSDATNPKKLSPARKLGLTADDVDRNADILQVSGNDKRKENFIRQAMQDEGGNVPEEVADTLLQHMQEKNPTMLKKLMDDHEITSSRAQYGTEINPQSLAELSSSMANVHSIPEMLAMHYDLNPALLGKSYDIPAPAYKTRPTQ